MEESYSPRTVAIVALGSLVLGFLLVFGLGTWVLRPHSQDTSALPPEPPATPAPPRRTAPSGGDAGAPVNQADNSPDDAGSAPEPPTAQSNEVAEGDAGAEAPATPGSATIAPVSVSRCFDGLAPTALPGPTCGGLPGFDAHMQSRSAQVAACAHGGHGHLALYLDFRFSTSFVRGWGLPSTTVPNGGVVATCVRSAISPLPFGTMQHAHDRYIAVVGIDF